MMFSFGRFKRLGHLFVAIILTGVCSSTANALDLVEACQNYLSKPAAYKVVGAILTFEAAEELQNQLSKRIEDIFENKEVTDLDKAEQSYEAYLRLRFSRLPAKASEQIRDLVENRLNFYIDNNKDSDFDCAYKSDSKSIRITMSDFTKYTILDYMVRVHEIEHAIQYLFITNPYGQADPRHYLFYKFAQEQGAMAAEGAFIGAFPLEVRQALFKSVQENSKMARAERYFYSLALPSAVLARNPREYVVDQWKRGRYSRRQFLLFQAMASTPAVIMGVPIIGGLIDAMLKQIP